MVKFRRIPQGYYRVDSRGAGTVAIQDKRTGLLQGRARTSGKGDRTRTRRITRDLDVNHDRKIDYFKGEIVGRSPRPAQASASRTIKVSGSRRARAYQRQI